MSQVITNDGFKEALRSYLDSRKMTIAKLADEIGKGKSTLGTWLTLGIKRDDLRGRIASSYPEIFEVANPRTPSVLGSESSFHPEQDLLVLVRTEQARACTASLGFILQWFLFKASAKDRDRFRDLLGDDWKNFLELTRAMTGETAFEVTRTEGRLDWCLPKAQ